MNEAQIAFEKAKNKAISYLTEKYGFQIAAEKFNNTTITKNNMQMTISFDLKDGSDLIFLDKYWQNYQYERFLSFVFMLFPLYSEAKLIIKEIIKEREQFENDYSFFENTLFSKIQYIEINFPQVFEQGDLTMFKK